MKIKSKFHKYPIKRGDNMQDSLRQSLQHLHNVLDKIERIKEVDR